jgi:release factor glutamine methyltransferase
VTVTWAQLVDGAAARITRAEARRILAEVVGLDDGDPSVEPGAAEAGWDRGRSRPTARARARFDELVARREAGEPLQYVLGRWGFRTLDLMVDRRVLIPRPETELLAGLAIAEVRTRLGRDGPVRVVDLGTGSGAVALAVAAEVNAAALSVWATDVSAQALAVARANLAGVGRAAARVRVAEGDWFDALPSDLAGTIDVAVSNPPYVADGDELPEEVAAWEPRLALVSGPAGTEQHARIVAEAGRWLAPGGVLLMELAPHQAAVVAGMAAAAGLRRPVVHPDLSARLRVLVAGAP